MSAQINTMLVMMALMTAQAERENGDHNSHYIAWLETLLPEQEATPQEHVELLPWECPECGEFRPDDGRVEAGMRCYCCAYGCDAVDLADSCGLHVTDLYPEVD